MKRLIEYEKRDEISKGNVNYVNKNIKYTTKYQTKHLSFFLTEYLKVYSWSKHVKQINEFLMAMWNMWWHFRFLLHNFQLKLLSIACCLFFFYIQILITPLVSCSHCVVCSSSIYRFWLPLWYLVAIVLSVLLLYTDSDYPFGIL